MDHQQAAPSDTQSEIINSIDDIRNSILTSKLTLQVANNIFNSPLKDEFIVTFFVLLNSLELHSTTKVVFLSSCLQNKLYPLASTVLDSGKITFVEVLKCLRILDSKRASNQLKKKLNAILAKYNQRKERIQLISTQYLLEKSNLNNNNNEQVKKEEEKEEKKEEKKDNESLDPTRKIKDKKYGSKKVSTKKNNSKSSNKRPTDETKRELVKNNEDDKPSSSSSKSKLSKLEKKKREETIERRHNFAVKCLENKIKELEAHQYQGSLSGNIVRLFKKWFASINEKTLEYFALGQPKETWKEIADLLHLSPKDFKLPWFLDVMFGKPAPEGTSVRAFDDLDKVIKEAAVPALEAGKEFVPVGSVEMEQLIEKYRPPYSFLRKRLEGSNFTPKLRTIVARYEELSTVVWWYHEFNTLPLIDKILVDRINTEILNSATSSSSSSINLAIGTLIEKLLALSGKSKGSTQVFNSLLRVTVGKLNTFASKFTLPPPIATLGDKSGSMEIAVRLATIIGYLVTNLTPESTLSFFNTESHPAPTELSSINTLFNTTNVVRATGGTSPAAGLWPYLRDKIALKYLVLVTDEEENQNCQGMDFTAMYKKYIDEVAPKCKLIFVSFLAHGQLGQMVTQIKSRLHIEPLQFVLDRSSPDVTKIDHMLTSLSCESELFKYQNELLCTVQSLFGLPFFLKYMNENKHKFFTYPFNAEMMIMIIEHLIKYYRKQLDDKPEFAHFKSRVFSHSNCMQMIKENLKKLSQVAEQSELVSLSAFVDDFIKTFNTLPSDKGIDFLSNILTTLDSTLLYKPPYKVITLDASPETSTDSTSNGMNSDSIIKDKIIQSSLTIPDISLILKSPSKNKFISIFLMLLNNLDLNSKIKIYTLCAAFECSCYAFVHLILYNKKIGFKEVSKVISILDSKRQVRVLQSKLDNAIKTNDQRIQKIKDITDKWLHENNQKIKDNNNNIQDKKSDTTTTTTTTTTKETTTKTPSTSVRGGSRGRGARGRGARGRGARGRGGSRGVRGESTSIPKKEEEKKEEDDEKEDDDKKKIISKKQREKLIKERYEASLESLKNRIASLGKYQSNGTLSGSNIRIFKKYLQSMPEKTLEYFALGQPKETWKEMADLLHLSPKDFQADWFLSVMYDKPHTSEVVTAFNREDLFPDELSVLIKKFKPSYSFIRKKLDPQLFTDDLKYIIAEYEELSVVLWWYHELATFEVDQLISKRLLNGDLSNANSTTTSSNIITCGTLLEKAMYFQQQGIPIFQDILPLIVKSIESFSNKFSLAPPLAVFGDASASMNVAIKLSTIISSLITSLTANASLSFFNSAPIWAPINPRVLSEVLNVSNIIQGSGATAPSAALYPFYEKGDKLKYVVLVSDEEENQLYRGHSFTQLYGDYLKKVAPDCKLVLVSFLRQHDDGQLKTEIQDKLGLNIIHYRLDKNRPDVTKIDDLITTLSCQSESFPHQVEALELLIEYLGDRHFQEYTRKNSHKYFTELYTFEILFHILDLHHRCTMGMELSEEEACQSTQDHILHVITDQGSEKIASRVINKLQSLATHHQYDDLLVQLESLYNIRNDTNKALFIVLEDYHKLLSTIMNQKYLYQRKDVTKINEETINNNHQINNQKNDIQDINNQKSITLKREKGQLNEYDLNILFGYIHDLKSLKSCSLVNRLWRKCSQNPQHWTRFINQGEVRDLDLVFLVDDTGSMSGEIEECKTKIREIVDDISSIGSVSVRVAMVFYNDHTKSNNNAIEEIPDEGVPGARAVFTTFDFTNNIEKMKQQLESVQVGGGDDEPEAMADGLHQVTKLSFKPSSTRVMIIIGDANPHGFSNHGSGDHFPNGCPCGHDVIQLSRYLITQLRVTIYSALCRPASHTFQVFSALADMSEGRCVALSDANELTHVITGSAKERIHLDSIVPVVMKEIESVQKQLPLISLEEAIYRASYSLRKQKVTIPRVKESNKSIQFDKETLYNSIIRSNDMMEFKARMATSKDDNNNNKKGKKQSKVDVTTTADNDSIKFENDLITILDIQKIVKKNSNL